MNDRSAKVPSGIAIAAYDLLARRRAATTDVVIPPASAVRSACLLDATPSQQPLRRQAWRGFGRQ